jgi:hypothetical protein
MPGQAGGGGRIPKRNVVYTQGEKRDKRSEIRDLRNKKKKTCQTY